MNNSIYNKIRGKVGWLIKKRYFAVCGHNCHAGYNLALKNPQNIFIGDNFSAGKELIMETWTEYAGIITNKIPRLIFGSNVSIMDNCQFSCADEIIVGNGVLFGSNVFVTDNFHGKGDRKELDTAPIKRNLYIKGKVSIGDNVWIGRNVCIMPNVSIGNSAIIGANSVVTKNIPAYSIVAGVPAKVIRLL